MKNKRLITILTLIIALLSAFVSAIGIFSKGGPGPYEITSIRGEKVMIYGQGAYRDMSLEVAPQGIAQDVVTLFIAVPFLLFSLWIFRQGKMRGKILLSGTLGYFLLTYTFFTLMAMYNMLFLPWVLLLSLSFFSFYLVYKSIPEENIQSYFSDNLPVKFIGGFLIFSAIAIGFLWLSIVLPAAIQGVVPTQTEHYTTLVVQALDLALALPLSFIAGFSLYRRKSLGFVLAPVYIIFLTLLITALTAKVIAMALLGYNVIPVIFIIPFFNVVALICSILTLKNTRELTT